MPEGTVKWFNPKKGYGFIAGPDNTDVFVHYSDIAGDGYKTLVEGDMVSFDMVNSKKGLRAENVVHTVSTKLQHRPVIKTRKGS